MVASGQEHNPESETDDWPCPPVSADELRAAACWFPHADKVPGDPAMTEFKQQVRLRQAQWRGDLEMGTHPNTRRNIEAGRPARIPNGVKLTDADGHLGRNFLSPEIFEAAKSRLRTKQPHQTLGPTRLRNDLLSSMPMCFNLFGELPADPARANAVATALLGHDVIGPTTVRFEWSPGRLDELYTGDKTAFDVALDGGTPGRATIVGIETKYHEHALTEAPPTGARLDRYRQIANMGVDGEPVFADDWETRVLGKPLQQIWRDHLLLLSMLQTGNWSKGRYVLVYPRSNVSFHRAAKAYREALVNPVQSATFTAVTIEELLAMEPLTPGLTSVFRERYLACAHHSARLA